MLGAGLGSLFGVVGALLWTVGWWQRSVAVRAFREGKEFRGEVVDVFLDRRVRVNRMHPWRVVFRFEVDGEVREDRATYWDIMPPMIEPGAPVVVLHTPSRSVLWTRLERRHEQPMQRLRVAPRVEQGSPVEAELEEHDAEQASRT